MRLPTLTVIVLLASCKGPGHAKVGETLLAQADSATIQVAPLGTMVVIPKTAVTEAQKKASFPWPADETIELALSWDIPWSQVNKMLLELEKAGKNVHLVVGQNEKRAVFQLEDKFEDFRVLRLNDQGQGKACLTAPNVKEGKCVQSWEKKYIDRAGVREIVREGVKSLGIEAVQVEVWPETLWGDVVRLIDGARTCCGATRIKVRLSPDSRRP